MSAKSNENEITDHDAAGLVIAAAQAALKKMPGRVLIKHGTMKDQRSVMVVLTGFEVRGGAVIDLVANGGKPAVEGGGE